MIGNVIPVTNLVVNFSVHTVCSMVPLYTLNNVLKAMSFLNLLILIFAFVDHILQALYFTQINTKCCRLTALTVTKYCDHMR